MDFDGILYFYLWVRCEVIGHGTATTVCELGEGGICEEGDVVGFEQVLEVIDAQEEGVCGLGCRLHLAE
jgi:hypothetical protein